MQKPTAFIPRVLWLTGLSGAGKSTTAHILKTEFDQMGIMNYLLDGDILRQGLCNDLGFSEADRYENCRRMAEVAKLFVNEGYMVICAIISPYKNMRQMVRERFSDNQFIEVFIDAPLSVCEARDPKGLYKKARAGSITSFTGVGSEYEAPANPEIHLRTDLETPEMCAQKIIEFLQSVS